MLCQPNLKNNINEFSVSESIQEHEYNTMVPKYCMETKVQLNLKTHHCTTLIFISKIKKGKAISVLISRRQPDPSKLLMKSIVTAKICLFLREQIAPNLTNFQNPLEQNQTHTYMYLSLNYVYI